MGPPLGIETPARDGLVFDYFLGTAWHAQSAEILHPGHLGVAGHFGRQMRRDRLAHGWTIAELARRAGLNPAHLSRIENGTRPPTARIAAAIDGVFTEGHETFILRAASFSHRLLPKATPFHAHGAKRQLASDHDVWCCQSGRVRYCP
jgi:DNA-binding XRE family transcriptional regulator